MNYDALEKLLLSRKGAARDYPFGPEAAIFKVAGKGGTDAFPRLFEEMRMELSSRYPVGITFINKVNERSHHAHTRKLGMVVVDEFEYSGREYYGLAFDTAQSVFPSGNLKTRTSAR